MFGIEVEVVDRDLLFRYVSEMTPFLMITMRLSRI